LLRCRGANRGTEEIIAAFHALSDADQAKAREGIAGLCWWCGRPSDRLCDGPVFDLDTKGILRPHSRLHERADESTCSAELCGSCSTAREIHGHMHTARGMVSVDDTTDRCPYCVEVEAKRRAARLGAIDYSSINEAFGIVPRTRHRELAREHSRTNRRR
jgi:hypothetical protein